jgi:hypothetical protein
VGLLEVNERIILKWIVNNLRLIHLALFGVKKLAFVNMVMKLWILSTVGRLLASLAIIFFSRRTVPLGVHSVSLE